LSSSHAWALLVVQVKEDIFKWITMNITWVQVKEDILKCITWDSSIGRYFEVNNYPRWHDDYPLIIFILDSQVAFGTK
jgi:hypothetical protein